MGRPVIGICSATEVAAWRGWEVLVNLSPRTYSDAVQDAGAMAVLLPPDDVTGEDPDEALDLVDGLVLAGGADIDPASYGARAEPETVGTWPERDRFELALAHRALERDIPLLGICRGMQLLNVALGGTLVQHVPDIVGNDDHRAQPGAFADHEVSLEPGSLAARAVGAESSTVRSSHHQGVEELGEGLRITGRSTRDELAEAIELPDKDYALGVLWHPEEDQRSRVIGSLVEEAKARQESRVR
ncbi:MAG TPA: gamma-glutamyl-gamma-aminobutyrate hydrolase family protein [Thermoleophilaceae bacterium]|nr:gamma-glutamyl-gamma-aminobutyrate hydrolase family protein [Thermoleophilaceae bacterium]